VRFPDFGPATTPPVSPRNWGVVFQRNTSTSRAILDLRLPPCFATKLGGSLSTKYEYLEGDFGSAPTPLSPECIMIPSACRAKHRGAPGMHSKHTRNAFEMYSKHTRKALGMHSEGARNVLGMHSERTRNALGTHSECTRNSLGIHSEFIRNSLGTHSERARNTFGMHSKHNSETPGMRSEGTRNALGMHQSHPLINLRYQLGLCSTGCPIQNGEAPWLHLSIPVGFWDQSCDRSLPMLIGAEPESYPLNLSMPVGRTSWARLVLGAPGSSAWDLSAPTQY
jgi:hypothetical protein